MTEGDHRPGHAGGSAGRSVWADLFHGPDLRIAIIILVVCGALFYVTTGFLNATDSVRLIWLTQAGVIVIGHMLAVLLSHAIAVDMFTNARKATISQIPQALFMIVYTLVGLWLLAAPRGASLSWTNDPLSQTLIPSSLPSTRVIDRSVGASSSL